VTVLFEREYKGQKGVYEGKTDNYITVITKSDKDISGEFYDVKIGTVKGNVAQGILLS